MDKEIKFWLSQWEHEFLFLAFPNLVLILQGGYKMQGSFQKLCTKANRIGAGKGWAGYMECWVWGIHLPDARLPTQFLSLMGGTHPTPLKQLTTRKDIPSFLGPIWPQVMLRYQQQLPLWNASGCQALCHTLYKQSIAHTHPIVKPHCPALFFPALTTV